MARCAEGHRQTLNELLGSEFCKSRLVSTFRLLLVQLDVPGFEALLLDRMKAQPGEREGLKTLVYDGKTLRGNRHPVMRGQQERIGSLLSYVSIEDRIPVSHALRRIRKLAEETLDHLNHTLCQL
jgi:hypothetical protein